MKTVNVLRIAAIQVAVAMGMVSCNLIDPDDEDDDDNNTDTETGYVVSLNCTGEITDDSVITSEMYEGKNLYYVQAYRVGDGYEKYAHGLFNVTDSMKITLEPGNEYMFKATVVENGLERIKHLEDTPAYYGAPFMTALTNKFEYTSDFNGNYIGGGETETTGLLEGVFTRPSLNRYYGESEPYLANDSVRRDVDICMLKTAFALKITTENFTEGTLKVRMDGAPEITMVYPETEFAALFAMENPEEAFRTDWNEEGIFTYDYAEDVNISAVYIDENGEEQPVGGINTEVVRNKEKPLVIELSRELEPGENGFNIVIEEDGMIEDDEVVDFEG